MNVPGIDVPDHRGRTGLDQVGRDLTGNPDVVVRDVELLAGGWHVLRRTTLERRRPDGSWTTEQRETYDRGNGATLLLYDVGRRTVLLSRQFRFPVYVNGHPDGMLLETAALQRRPPEHVPAAGQQLDVPYDDVGVAGQVAAHLVQAGAATMVGDVDAGHAHEPTLGRGVAHLGG